MGSFTESLTVRILGDSSQLQRELDLVGRQIGELQGQLGAIADLPRQLESGLSRLTGISRPLEQLSRVLERITSQARGLSQIPIVLNVAPALQSLAMLSAMIDVVTAKLVAMSALRGGAGVGGGFGLGAGMVRPIVRLAAGGVVSGPAGVDRVPAMLSAGEFVLQRSAVQRIGVDVLNAINRGVQRGSDDARDRMPSRTESSTTNHFGAITLNVARPADVNEIVRDLRFHGFRLRNRRG